MTLFLVFTSSIFDAIADLLQCVWKKTFKKFIYANVFKYILIKIHTDISLSYVKMIETAHSVPIYMFMHVPAYSEFKTFL